MRAGSLLGIAVMSMGISADRSIRFSRAGDGSPHTAGADAILSFNDSPFAVGSFVYFHLEDFEDSALNTPGVNLSVTSLRTSITPPSEFTDSVDGDDGSIDGSGQGGHSLYLGNLETALWPLSATFTFDATSLGALPTHVGMVWTDVGFSTIPSTAWV